MMASPDAMSEKELQALVVRAAQLLAWLVYHTHDSRRSQRGYPDLCLVKDRVLFRELKTDRGRLTPAQRVWLERLGRAGADVGVWRPESWRNGDILRELRDA
jgi:hypothetical protein